MKLRMSLVVSGLVFVSALYGFSEDLKTKQKSKKESNAEETKDFLFLAEQEPGYEQDDSVSEGKQPVVVQEDDVVIVPKKGDPKPVVIQADLKKSSSESKAPSNFVIKSRIGEFTLSGKYRIDGFYGKNMTLLNDCARLDRIFQIKHAIDLVGDAKCGAESRYGLDLLRLKFGIRSRGVWGNPLSIVPTSDATVKEVGSIIGGPHRHSIGRHILWIRELWMKSLLNGWIDASDERKHYLIVGFYPFSLGHGIALGDAYAVNPTLLGFYGDNIVDQYAPGILLTGDVVKDWMTYDIYGAIIENKADSVGSNAEPVYAQRYGRRTTPERGFGHVNWLMATRFKAKAWKSDDYGTLELEPYALVNRAPEQRVEFTADAESTLGTFGISAEYQRNNFEAGFEFAHNVGEQRVHGWDRNRLILEAESTTGDLFLVNSHVLDTSLGSNRKARKTSANQTLIDASAQSESQNGLGIGGTLVNASDRFSDCIQSTFKGWMLYADMGYWMFDKQFQIAAAGGIASGDEDPNLNLDNPKINPGDGSFDGFLGLQEVFAGNRVESAYILGQRRITRPLSLPNEAVQRGFVASTVSEFTDIRFLGLGFKVVPQVRRMISWRPNIMVFWDDIPKNSFDIVTKKNTNHCASRFLGMELNSFLDAWPTDCLKASLVLSLFIPGSHYSDVKGTPVSADQLRLFEQAHLDISTLPLLGTDKAFLINASLEYKF